MRDKVVKKEMLFISNKFCFSKSVVPTMVVGDYAPLCSPVRNSSNSPTGSASLWNLRHPDSDFDDDLVVIKLPQPLKLTLRSIEDHKSNKESQKPKSKSKKQKSGMQSTKITTATILTFGQSRLCYALLRGRISIYRLLVKRFCHYKILKFASNIIKLIYKFCLTSRTSFGVNA